MLVKPLGGLPGLSPIAALPPPILAVPLPSLKVMLGLCMLGLRFLILIKLLYLYSFPSFSSFISFSSLGSVCCLVVDDMVIGPDAGSDF